MYGHVGVLHYIENETDVDWIIENGIHAPYIPLFRSDLFDLRLLKRLKDKNKISGALAIAVPSGKYRYTPENGSSPDYACPNNRFGAYNGDKDYANCRKVKWNKDGTGMSFKYYDIPMFALTDEKEVTDLVECYQKHNSQAKPDYPLCAVELKDFMYAAKDTPTCIRKTKMPNPTGSEFCQPLGDQNVWGTLYPIKEPLAEKEVVMVAAKLDSSSFFHDLTPGVENDGTGIIVLLAAAKLLGDMKRNGSFPAPKNPIMFTLFNGESWDYIGSSRMVYDMVRNKFPSDDQTWKVGSSKKKNFTMETSNIKYFIEVNQVGLIDDDGPLWVHSDPVSIKNTGSQVKDLLNAFQNAGRLYGLNVSEPDTTQPLPPASFQRFLRSDKKIPGVVLTDHKEHYSNKFYNSHFDDLYQVGGNFSKENDTVYLLNDFTKKLAKIAATLARTLYILANDSQPPEYEINADNDTEAVIGHLAYCFFVRANCPLYREVFSIKSWNSLKDYTEPFPRYVSVSGSDNIFTSAIYYLLLYFTGDRSPFKSGECSGSVDEGIVNASMQGKDFKSSGLCVTGAVYLSPAVSPAFVLEKYDSTEYSTWAESTWGDDLTVRLFLVGSPQLEGATLAAGLIITVFSFGLVYLINKKANVLFTPNSPLDADVDS